MKYTEHSIDLNEEVTMTNYVFTHNDLDGCGCAILAKKTIPDTKVIFCHYDDIEPKVLDLLDARERKEIEIDTLYILDICPSEQLCEILDSTRDLDKVLVDHHHTKSRASKYDWVVFNNDYCATRIFHNLSQICPKIPTTENDAILSFVNAVEAWDLWKLNSPSRRRGINLNALAHFIGFEEFVDKFSIDSDVDHQSPYREIIKYINEDKERYVKSIIDEQLKKAPYQADGFNGDSYKVLFAERFVSEVAEAALSHEDSEDLHFVIVANVAKDSCSLRTKRDDIDMGKMATFFGGGGHQKAAGFPSYLMKTVMSRITKLMEDPNVR